MKKEKRKGLPNPHLGYGNIQDEDLSERLEILKSINDNLTFLVDVEVKKKMAREIALDGSMEGQKARMEKGIQNRYNEILKEKGIDPSYFQKFICDDKPLSHEEMLIKALTKTYNKKIEKIGSKAQKTMDKIFNENRRK